jgi:mono/diheme cytochrome c family protein
MRKTPAGFLIPALLFVASLAAAVAGAAADKNEETDSRGVLMAIAKAPAKARDWKNPYEGNAEALLAGKKLYVQHCAECHGENARGMRNAVSLRAADVQNATPGELVWFLRNGNLFHGMPSWSGLPEQRRWQVVTYLKSLR